ncbi:hypothetical protein H8D79_00005, partial [PVC group bacterium]|nr:hypothetical protein [PVC group bacterium]
ADVIATLGGKSASASVEVPHAFEALTITPNEVPETTTVELKVILSLPASDDTSVSLRSSAPDVLDVPETVTFTAGKLEHTLSLTTTRVGQAEVTATLGNSTRSATLEVQRVLQSARVEPSEVTEGKTVKLWVTLSAPTAEDTKVSLSSSKPEVAEVPGTVDIPTGTGEVSVSVEGLKHGNTTFTAQHGATVTTAELTVLGPVKLKSLSLEHHVIGVGQALQSTTLEAELDREADEDQPVTLEVFDPTVVTVTQLTVRKGQRKGTSAVTAAKAGKTQIKAQLDDKSGKKVCHLEVKDRPLEIASLTLSAAPLIAGEEATLTIALSAAPTVDTKVRLSCSRADILSLPANVTVVAGATTHAAAVTPNKADTGTIGASFKSSVWTDGQWQSVDRESSIDFAIQSGAPEIESVRLDPATVKEGDKTQLRIVLSSPAPEAVTVSLDNSKPKVAEAPSSLTVAAGAKEGSATVQALKHGKATFTARVGDSAATAELEVTKD